MDSLCGRMTTKTPVRLVCFDLGGVLVRIARGWDDACRRAGVSLTHGGADAWTRHHDLMLRYETGEIDEAGYLGEAPGVVGGGVTADAIVRVFDAWLLGMYAGAADLIDELRARGYQTACLSNTNARHWDTLNRHPDYEPLRRLDYRLASHQLKVMKPHENAYRRAEAATGVWGDQVLFFDDKAENVRAARAMNWRAELVDRADDAVPQIRDYLAAHAVL
jgi:putative hydrolase of the HAD superfamily